MSNKVLYGDYVYLQVAPADKKDKKEPENYISGTGFYASQVYAGKASHLSTKNYLSCLFQICPNQHSDKDKFSSEAQNRFKVLKAVEVDSAAVRALTKEITLEQIKEKNRSERVDLLNRKEKEETTGNALKVKGKFTLRHVESGMFLEILPRMNMLANKITDVRLTDQPNTENYFTLLPLNQNSDASENVEYGDPFLIYSSKYNIYLTHAPEPYLETIVPRQLNFRNNPYIDNDKFPKLALRRQEAYQENQTKFVAGGQLNEAMAVFQCYKRNKLLRLKTGDYIRIICGGLYLTINWYGEGKLNRLLFQTFDSIEYKCNQINSIFLFVPVLTQENELPSQEVITTVNIDKLAKAKDLKGQDAKKYYVKHYASGCFLVLDSAGKPTLVTEEQLRKSQEYWSEIIVTSKPFEGVQQVGVNFGFVLGFTKGDAVKYLTTGEVINIRQSSERENWTYFLGYDVTDEQVYKKLRPTMKELSIVQSLNDRESDCKYEIVKKTDMHAILKTESLANQMIFYLEFLSDFKSPYERRGGDPKALTHVKGNPEKSSLLALNAKTRSLANDLRRFVGKEPMAKIKGAHKNTEEEAAEEKNDDNADTAAIGGDDDEQDDDTDKSQVPLVQLWAAREFRIIDMASILIHAYLVDERLTKRIKEVSEKYGSVPDFVAYDKEDFIFFITNLIEVLLLLIRKDYNNHSYATQYTRTYIHAILQKSERVIFYEMPLAEKYYARELLLELLCEALWAEDLDAIGQLNFYIKDVFQAIGREDSYQGLFIRILNHQARSNAPNLQNIIQEQFIRDFLTQPENIEHVFPKFDLSGAEPVVKFVRLAAPAKSMDVSISALTEAFKSTDLSTAVLKNRATAKYLIHALTLANSIAQTYDLYYYQTLMKHYPYETLNKIVALISSDFYQVAVLLTEIMNKVHKRYIRLPIKSFPPQIRIVGDTGANIIKDVNSKITSCLESLISDLEWEVIGEKNLRQEIEGCRTLALHQVKQESDELGAASNNTSNPFYFVSTIKSALLDSTGMIDIEKLIKVHDALCKILEDIIGRLLKKNEKIPGANSMILEILSIFNMLEDKMISQAALEMIAEISKSPHTEPPKQLQDGISPQLGEKERLISAKQLSTAVPSLMSHAQSAAAVNLNNLVLGSVIKTYKNEWKTVRDDSNLHKGGNVQRIQTTYKEYITRNLLGHLFDLTLLKDNDITLQVIQKFSRVSNFETRLFVELKKLTILPDPEEIRKTALLTEINLRLNEHIRLFKAKEVFGKTIPNERILKVFKDIEKKIDTLFLMIYQAKKHFRYKDLEKDAEERLLEGFNKWKAGEWDKPFKIVGEAVSQLYQKIYSALKIPETLFEILGMAMSIKKGGGIQKSELDISTVIRKILTILTVYVYRNPENQDYLSQKKFIILNYYKQEFINLSCDTLTLFSEMIRGNRYLQKLPSKYLYDITYYTFLGTLKRPVSAVATNGYLTVVMKSLHYLVKAKAENFDAAKTIRHKFNEIFEILSSEASDSINLFKICQAQDPKLVDLPFCYFTIREFFHSWLQIREGMSTSFTVVNRIFDGLDLPKWEAVIASPHTLFLFEIRNLFCKTMAQTWYASKGLQIVQEQKHFKNLMFRLLADLDSFISFMASQTKHEALADYKLDFGWIAPEEKVKAHRGLYETFKKEKMHEKQLFIYAEHISVLNLWKEYIYDGLLEFLNLVVIKQAEEMAHISDAQNKEYPNLLAYYLQLALNLSYLPFEGKDNPFVKLYHGLQTASLMHEYKPFKSLILETASKIKDIRPELKGQTKFSSKTKKDNPLEIYDKHAETLNRDSGMIVEFNTGRLATALSSSKEYKKVITQIILIIRRNYLRIDSKDIIFTLKFLRKIIEKENHSASPSEPIYMWKAVKISELKRITNLQKLYLENGLTNFIFRLAAQMAETESKILKEIVQLGLAYLYGGNKEVQQEFYQKFAADEDNTFLRKLGQKMDDATTHLRVKESERMSKLYDLAITEMYEGEENVTNIKDETVLFSRVSENFETELTIDATADKKNSLLLLIISFLQCLAEGQCYNLQHFLRDQKSKSKEGQPTRVRTSLNFLAKLRTLFNSYYKIHSTYNVTIGYKIVDALTEFIQGDVKDNVTDVLKKTMLYDACKLLTEYNNQLHLLPRGYDPDPFTGNFKELKSKVIGFLKNIAEVPDQNVLTQIKRYIDLGGLLDVFEGCLFKYFQWNENAPPLTFRVIDHAIAKITNEDIYERLGDAFNIYIIFRYLWEDKETFQVEIKRLIKESGRSEAKAAALDILFSRFCLKTVCSVEVLNTERQVDLVKYWFPLFPACQFLRKTTKDHFHEKVDRTNAQTKIRGLMDFSEEIIPQMVSDYKSRHMYFGLNANNFYYIARKFTNLIGMVITMMNIFTLSYDQETSTLTTGSDEVVAARFALNLVNTGVAGLVVILWLVTGMKHYLQSQWEKYSDEVQKREQIISQAVQEKFQQEDIEGITKDECLRMLEFKGLNSDEWDTMKRYPELYEKVKWFYHRTNLVFLLTSTTFVWHLVYLGLSIGSIFHPIVTTLLFSDIAIQSDRIMAVLQAVTTNWKQFLWALFLLLFVATFYMFIGFFTMQDALSDGENYFCNDAFGCLLTYLDLGLRNGGGIGDSLVALYYSPESPWTFIARVVYELSFFLIVIIILLNLIFGMIIDAFGDLRDQKVSSENDQENVCFICGIDRSEFERYMNFDDHTTLEHNLWDYLYFITYIRERYNYNKTDLNEIENTVYEKYTNKVYDWIPVLRSLSLENKKKALGSQEDDLSLLQNSLKTLSTEVKEVKDLSRGKGSTAASS